MLFLRAVKAAVESMDILSVQVSGAKKAQEQMEQRREYSLAKGNSLPL